MKFAYLIMAHNNPEQLEILLELLDCYENDIYLHIDKKNKDIDEKKLHSKIKCANLHIYRKYKVYWASLSQTKCQFYLLEQATKEYHDYYHLLSGNDLPLKRNKEIQAFFKKNKGKEFVHFESHDYCEKENCVYYHFFYTWSQVLKGSWINVILGRLEKISILIQKRIGIKRKLFCGANWYSITDKLAKELVYHKKRLINHVKYSISSDEYVLQSYIKLFAEKEYNVFCVNENDYYSIVRAIDWQRGSPYVWKYQDRDYLLNCEMLFARKFDMRTDYKIIQLIKDMLEEDERY